MAVEEVDGAGTPEIVARNCQSKRTTLRTGHRGYGGNNWKGTSNINIR